MVVERGLRPPESENKEVELGSSLTFGTAPAIKYMYARLNLQAFALDAARLSPLIQELLYIIQIRVQRSYFF